jgi:tetratricopeptide (TPR) repeat protein
LVTLPLEHQRDRLDYSHTRHSQGNTEQAIYCYSKAIRLDPNDCDAIWDRSVIYAEQGKHDKGSVVLHRRVSFQLSCRSFCSRSLCSLHVRLIAIRGFVALHELTKGDTDVSKELARVDFLPLDYSMTQSEALTVFFG